MTPDQLRRLAEMFMTESKKLDVEAERERCIMIALDLIELAFMKQRRAKLHLVKD